MLFANVCAGFIHSCYGEFWVWHFLGFLASLLCLVCLGSASFASLPFAQKTWVYFGVPLARHVLLALFSGGITFGITGGSVRQLIKIAFHDWLTGIFINGKPYMLGLTGTAQSPW